MPYELKFPDIGEGVVEGEIIRWLIRSGDHVEEDQPMVEVMTDKATVEIPSPVSGEVLKTVGGEGETIAVGATLVVIDAPEGPDQVTASSEKLRPQEAPSAASSIVQQAPVRSQKQAKNLATPAVRRFAREMAIDLSGVQGTGSGGRITRLDVERARSQTSGVSSQAKGAPDSIPYRGVRKKIGDHLVAAKRFAPHYTYVEEVDATPLVELRSEFQRYDNGQDLTYLPFIIKACVSGLKKHAILNSTLDEEKKLIQLKRSYNIGVAIATPEGLIVPVIKNADDKSVLDISAEIRSLGELARSGRIRLEDLRGGTFTITSLGALGGVLATPIINYPEVAILGVHKIMQRPVVRKGEVVIRHMMNLSLSLDHRVVDGFVGAEFLRDVISHLENPGLLSID